MAPERDPRLSDRSQGGVPDGSRDGETDARVSPVAAASAAPHGDPLSEEVASQEREEQEGPPADAPEAPVTPAGEPEAPVAPPAQPPIDEAGEDPAATHEQKLARDLEELTAKAQKADQYLELAQRTQADFENYRRRAAREAAAAQERGIVKLAKELLPAIDNLDRALEAVAAQDGGEADSGADGDGSLLSGIKLVHADVVAALNRAGIERFSPQGEPFDPQHHEAVAQLPVESAEPGTVVEVYQRGYRIGETVLRPARVVVAQ